jgi:hypothetical protein
MGTNTRVAIVAGEDAGPSFGSTPVPGPRTLIASRTEPGVPGAPTRTATTSSQGATAAGPSRTNCRAADGPAAGFRAISCASGHWAPSAGRPPSRFEGGGPLADAGR